MAKDYDAIVVGARCAGSPVAMLLARKGYNVLVVDRATFPSDIISTHVMHPPGVAALKRWGLLDRLETTNVPPMSKYTFDFGPVTISGTPGTAADSRVAYCVRRTVLDKILVDAASEAGADVREGFAVDDLLIEDGRVCGIRGHSKGEGGSVTERAPVVIGADGRHSIVARIVEAPVYNEVPQLEAGYYSYWSGVEVGSFENHIRPGRAAVGIPTNDGLTVVITAWPMDEFEANRRDVEGNHLKTIEMVPEFAERVKAGQRESRVVGTDLPNFFRKPYGPGWTLIGDAGHTKDPSTAQGISRGFHDAELVATALDETFTGARSFDDAMAGYQSARDAAAMPMYDFTCQLATLEPPPEEMQQLLGAMAGNQEAMDRFTRMFSGSLPVPEFFAPENLGSIMAGAR